jgi:hypothetical protein
MELEDIILSAISWAQKEKCYMVSLICGCLEVDLIEALTRGWGEWERGRKQQVQKQLHRRIGLVSYSTAG